MKSWTPGDQRFVREGMVKGVNEEESSKIKTEVVSVTGK